MELKATNITTLEEEYNALLSNKAGHTEFTRYSSNYQLEDTAGLIACLNPLWALMEGNKSFIHFRNLLNKAYCPWIRGEERKAKEKLREKIYIENDEGNSWCERFLGTFKGVGCYQFYKWNWGYTFV